MKGMVRLQLPARVDSLDGFCSFVVRGARACEMPAEETEKLCLVLEEVFMNVARHAYAPGQGDIEVGYAVEAPGRLLIEVSDSGRAFNPLAAPSPELSPNISERPLGGMGIRLIRTMGSSFRYRRRGSRNTFSFIYATARPAEPAQQHC